MSGASLDELRFHRDRVDVEAVFRAHYAEIVRYLAIRLGSEEDARDVASEVFVVAFTRLPTLRWRGRPVLAWLSRVAANMAADQVNTRARGHPAAAVAARPVETADD